MELANGTFGGRRVIDRQALLETRNPNLMSSPLASPNSRASFYGLGIGVAYDAAGRLRLSHSGAFALGAATTLVMLPSERLGIVVLTNAAPIGLPEAVAAEFMDLAEYGKVQYDWFDAYNGLFQQMEVNPSALAGKKPPNAPAPARPADAYTGTYANRYFGDATVVNAGGRLNVILGPHHQSFALTHWSGNVFSYMPRGENALGISAATFALNDAGTQARALTLENLNGTKLGTFVRAGN
jgi:hypothetical protein